MLFRGGANVAGSIDQEGLIYGDGGNIAAQVEALAEAGRSNLLIKAMSPNRCARQQ